MILLGEMTPATPINASTQAHWGLRRPSRHQTPASKLPSSPSPANLNLRTRTRLPLSLAVLEAVPLSALTPSDVQAATKKTIASINSAMLGTTQSVGSVWHTLDFGFLRLCPRATSATLCAALHATSRTHRTTLRGNGPTYHFSSALGLAESHDAPTDRAIALRSCILVWPFGI